MIGNIMFYMSYIHNKKEYHVEFNESFSNSDFKAIITKEENTNTKPKVIYERLKLTILPFHEIVISELYGNANYDFGQEDRIFVNGYQSWTDSREFFTDEKMNGISLLAKPVLKKYQFDKYGDYSFKKYSGRVGEFHGYTYSYIRKAQNLKFLGSMSERNGYTIFEYKVKKNLISISKECKGHHINSSYEAFDLMYAYGSEQQVFDTYFDVMKLPKPKAKPMNGWTSWYNYYQNINETIIEENLNSYSEQGKNIDVFQIDDGYQTAVGDWLSIDSNKFPNGMKHMANKIKAKGFKAGIWLAPFVCETKSEICNEKSDWLLKDKIGEPIMGGSNWSRFYVLDFYNQQVRDYIRSVFNEILKHWNYDMVKLDFLYAVCLLPRKDKTRGQIMTEAMEFLRECVGDKLILGCGVPLGPAFGLVDYCRIGCDVSLDWDDKPYMKLFHRERISTFNAIRNTIGRRHLNGRAFINDPDVFLLREENILLNSNQKKTLAYINRLFGGLLFTSDNLKKYDANMSAFYDEVMSRTEKFVKNVEIDRNGLIRVSYIENDVKQIAFANLSSKQIDLKSVYGKQIKGILETNSMLLPYETRLIQAEN